jgi:hypothetical protein
MSMVTTSYSTEALQGGDLFGSPESMKGGRTRPEQIDQSRQSEMN